MSSSVDPGRYGRAVLLAIAGVLTAAQSEDLLATYERRLRASLAS